MEFEAADTELAYMFLTDAKIMSFFQCAVLNVNLEEFSTNVKRLIVHYGKNLEEEARGELHKQAAKYVIRLLLCSLQNPDTSSRWVRD